MRTSPHTEEKPFNLNALQKKGKEKHCLRDEIRPQRVCGPDQDDPGEDSRTSLNIILKVRSNIKASFKVSTISRIDQPRLLGDTKENEVLLREARL